MPSADLPLMPTFPDWFGTGDDPSPTGVAGWMDLEMPDFGDYPDASVSAMFDRSTPTSHTVDEATAGNRSLTDTPVERLEPDSMEDLYLPGNPHTIDVLASLLSEFPDPAVEEISVPPVASMAVAVSAPLHSMPVMPALFPTSPEPEPTDSVEVPPTEGFFPDFGSTSPELAPSAQEMPAFPETFDPLDGTDPSADEVRTLRIPPQSDLTAKVLNYGLVAGITGTKPFFNFRVEHAIPSGVRLLGCDPMPSRRQGDRLTWEFGTLKPGDKYRIQMRVEPTGISKLEPDTFAGFETFYSHTTSHQTRVTRTVLESTLTAPASVERGEAVEIVAEVVNTGNWPSTGAVVAFRLPEGLEHPQGREVVVAPGRIVPGEKVRVAISARATGIGSLAVELQVDSDGGTAKTASCEIVIAAPELRLDLLPPIRIPVGETADVRVDIRNVGTGVARNIRANLQWPDGLEFVRADHSGKPVGRQVVWGFDDLAPAGTIALRVTLRPSLPGEYVVRGGCSSEGVPPTTAERPIRAEIDARENRRQIDEFVALMDRQESALAIGLAGATTSMVPANARVRADILEQHILFQLGDTEYALPIRSVMEVGRSRTIAPLPNVAPWLLGLSNLRGDVISVVDLRSFLGMDVGPASKNLRTIVVRTARDRVAAAIVVDRINGTAVIPEGSILTATSPIEDPVSPYVRGVSERDGRLLVLLDVDRLLLSPAFADYSS